MPQTIEVPGIGSVEFPDDMSDDQIASAIKANMSPARTPDPSLYSTADTIQNAALKYGKQAARAVGLAGRTILNTAAGAPLAAMDAGVAARNAVSAGDYQLPSKQWNDALNAAGVPQFQTPIEKGGDIAGQMLLGGKLPGPQGMGSLRAPGQTNLAPASFDPKSMRELAFNKARDAGLVVPPATTNPTVLNRFLESWGGKAATAQDASLMNQPKIDALVKSDLGLKATDDAAEGTLAALRKEAANTGYKPVRSVGTIRLDGDYSKALDAIAAPYAKSEKAFPGLNNTDVIATAQSLKQKAVDTDTAVDSIAILRDKADAAFRQGDGGAGKAYKEMAKALEGAIERSLGRRGSGAQKTLQDYRTARQLIAKTHSAEKALNPELGSFDARKLAQQLNAGKPLSGGAKKAGQAAQAFKEATRLLTDSGSVRNTDVILGGGAAALSGNPMPLLYPFSRMAVRDFMLSPAGQGLLATPSRGLPPGAAMGSAYGLLAQ